MKKGEKSLFCNWEICNHIRLRLLDKIGATCLVDDLSNGYFCVLKEQPNEDNNVDPQVGGRTLVISPLVDVFLVSSVLKLKKKNKWKKINEKSSARFYKIRPSIRFQDTIRGWRHPVIYLIRDLCPLRPFFNRPTFSLSPLYHPAYPIFFHRSLFLLLPILDFFISEIKTLSYFSEL